MLVPVGQNQFIMRIMFETETELEPDPVIEAYKKDVDRTLIRENLKLTIDERLRNLEALQQFAQEFRAAVRRATESGN